MRLFMFFLAVLILSGCGVRTYTIEKPRKDIEIEGNRGYLVGQPKDQEAENRLGDTRKFSVVEFELKDLEKAGRKVDPQKIWRLKRQAEPEIVEEEIALFDNSDLEDISLKEPKYEYYTVKKADTLQKISLKFYGTTRNWKLIYEENQEVLKNPNKIYPGLRIKVPVFE